MSMVAVAVETKEMWDVSLAKPCGLAFVSLVSSLVEALVGADMWLDRDHHLRAIPLELPCAHLWALLCEHPLALF